MVNQTFHETLVSLHSLVQTKYLQLVYVRLLVRLHIRFASVDKAL